MTEQKIYEMPEMFDAMAPGNEPVQGGGQLPPGKHLVNIVDGEIKANDSGDGHRVVIHFKCESGENAGMVQRENFNLWHSNEQTVRISRGKYSALCHATATFGVKNVKQFFGKQCMLDVVQDNKDPQYTKIRAILNADGSKPGAGNNGQQSMQQQPQGQMMGQQMMQQPQGNAMMGQQPTMQQQMPQNQMQQQPQGMGMSQQMPGQMMQQPQMQQPQGMAQGMQQQQPNNMQSWGQMQQQQQPQGQVQQQPQGMQNGFNQQTPGNTAPWGGQ